MNKNSLRCSRYFDDDMSPAEEYQFGKDLLTDTELNKEYQIQKKMENDLKFLLSKPEAVNFKHTLHKVNKRAKTMDNIKYIFFFRWLFRKKY